MLEKHGYNVHLGLDGRDGLNLFRHVPDIDLVVLELSAPGMSSQEAFAELLNIDPAAKIVVVTGHPMRGLWKGAAEVLLKPFDTARFLHTIRRVLESP